MSNDTPDSQTATLTPEVVMPETPTTPDPVAAAPTPAVAPTPTAAIRPARRAKTGFGKEEMSEEVVEPAPITIRIEDLKIEEVFYEDAPCTLPHGFFLDGKRLRVFSAGSFDAELDSRLGKLYSGQRVDIKQVLVTALPLVIKEVDGYTLAEIAEGSGVTVAQLIEQMPLADALTMIIGVRESFVGQEIAVADRCPNCKTRALDNPDNGREYHNTGSIKIGSIEELDQRLVVQVALEEGFVLHGQLCTIVEMRPIRLYELSKMPNLERGKLDVSMMQLQICGIPQCDRVSNVRGMLFSDKAYNSLTGVTGLRDRNALLAASEMLQRLGPEMGLENICDNCGEKWDSQLGWPDLRSFWFKPATPQLK